MIEYCSFFSGKKEERNYENGILNGPAIIYGTNGDKFEFNYVEGIIEGNAVYYAASGASEERTYRYWYKSCGWNSYSFSYPITLKCP